MFTRPPRGITLIEIILWVAIVAAAVVAVFAFAKATRVSAALETEQRQVETIVKTVDSLFALQPNFSALGSDGALYLTARNAERSGLTITRNAAGDPTLTTGLGDGRLTLSVWDVVRPVGPAIANGGYRLAYEGLSPKECAQLASALSSNTQQVSIGFNGLSDAFAAVASNRFDPRAGGPDVIANLCARPDRVVFLYFAPARAIAATGAVASPGPLARCRPVRETQYSACPVGQTGTVTQTRDGTCTGPGNTLVWTVWTTTNSTCQDAAVVPPTVVAATTPDDCATITTTRVQACTGVGETGQIVEQSTLDTCAGTSTPWTQVPALTTCQAPPPPACVSSSQREEHVPCPAGQGGEIVRERYSTCSSPTAFPSWPAWNSTHVVSNTCTSNCAAGAPDPFGNTCCTPIPETRPAPCPAGTYGPGGQEIRFLGCANATTQSTTWSAWQPYRDLEPSAGCQACPATTQETMTKWEPRSDACPSGESGSITYEAQQVQTRAVSYTCPANTTALPAPDYAAWTAWVDTGARRNTVNGCAPIATPGGEVHGFCQFIATPANPQSGSTPIIQWYSPDNTMHANVIGTPSFPPGALIAATDWPQFLMTTPDIPYVFGDPPPPPEGGYLSCDPARLATAIANGTASVSSFYRTIGFGYNNTPDLYLVQTPGLIDYKTNPDSGSPVIVGWSSMGTLPSPLQPNDHQIQQPSSTRARYPDACWSQWETQWDSVDTTGFAKACEAVYNATPHDTPAGVNFLHFAAAGNTPFYCAVHNDVLRESPATLYQGLAQATVFEMTCPGDGPPRATTSRIVWPSTAGPLP